MTQTRDIVELRNKGDRAMREIESFQSDRVSQEWLAGLDAAEAQGFKDSAAGLKCLPRKHGFYGTGITLYQRGWKAGLSARSVSVAK